jgi:O-acetylhomoserine (thiol)-lyase
VNLRKLGIDTTFVNPDDPENFRRALKPNTKLLYAETLGNPLINIVDLEAVGKIAREAGIPLVVDNTVPSPYLCRPFEWGADIVVHSATKYIGGHGTTMGGIIVESGKFPWGNGKFPGMTEPSRGYHGVIFHETFGDFGYTMKALMETLRTFGASLSPFNSWMLQGLETLPVRMGAAYQRCWRWRSSSRAIRACPLGSTIRGCRAASTTSSRRNTCPREASGLLNFGVKEEERRRARSSSRGDLQAILSPASATRTRSSSTPPRPRIGRCRRRSRRRPA